MSLHHSCEEYRNRSVIVKPIYGWGWSSTGDPPMPVPAEINGVPRPFSLIIRDFYRFEGELRGVIGIIKEPGHVYDRCWANLSLRVGWECNFTDEMGYYDLEIAQPEPIRGQKGWPEFPAGVPVVNGYGIVAESMRRIEKYDQRKHEEWEIVRDAMRGDV